MYCFFTICFTIVVFIILIYFFGNKIQNHLQISMKKMINKSKSKNIQKKIIKENYTTQNNTEENYTAENYTAENHTGGNHTTKNNINVIFCYADWCSHCPSVKEWYTDLVDKSPLSNINFIAFEEKNLPKELLTKIIGFPTILIKKNDSFEIYNGSRSKNSLLTYLETL